MAIKQLQLRGISRTPSDRASADGGCAESLNVHLDGGEVAPTLPPKDISADIYPSTVPSGEGRYDYRIVYIHKMSGITNYIGYNTSARTLRAYGSALSDSRTESQQTVTYNGLSFMGGAQLASGETLIHITSIGNTLIVYSDVSPYYFIFKENKYVFLGTKIPKIGVEVVSAPEENVTQWASPEDAVKSTSIDWNEAYAQDEDKKQAIDATMTRIWEQVAIDMGHYREQGIFYAPFFIRYALRMYDGSIIYSSSPILCGGGKTTDWVTMQLSTRTIGNTIRIVNFSYTDLYKVYLRSDFSVSTWGDLIKSIDIFASEPIYTPANGANFGSVDNQNYIVFEGMQSSVRNQTIKDAILSKAQFYKVASIEFGTTSMTNLTTGYYQLINSDMVSGDLLSSQEMMTDGYRDASQYIPINGSSNFNNRVLLYGVKETLGRGDMYLNGEICDGTYTTTPVRYAFRYKIVDSSNGQAHYVYAHYRDGNKELFPAYYDGTTTPPHIRHWTTSWIANCHPCAWISYPDVRCKEVQVFYKTTGGWNSKIFPMEEHPLLNCAYAFFGFGVELKDAAYPNAPYSDITAPETQSIQADNKLYLSEFENPYLFPAGNIITFPDAIVGAATTSVPLSEGQFGEFPLYVFTKGGIRVMVTTGEGTFAANMSHPNLSRHIAIPGTILGMEQAIVFTTERGVMLLSGNNVQELSAEMNGKPVLFDDGLADSGQVNSEMRNLIQGSAWAGLFNPMNDTNTFMQFVRSAKPAYDHNGGRLVFFHTTKQYQYEYRFTTQSWHKIYTSVANPTILNSYPDCYVSWFSNGSGKVLNFTTFLNSDTAISDTKVVDGQTVRNEFLGTIITRPIDLGEPDIRKAIRSIRVRGKYGRGAVQYVLLGSFDNIHWCRMKSLRGGSYKYFRIILLTSLTPNERITWIDVDYESRFTNRLR